jgi:B12-binding domain/radical SAM domain protein
MENDVALVYHYTKQNRNSYNVLTGALELDGYFNNLDIYFIDEKQNIRKQIPELLQKYKKLILAISFCTPQIAEIFSLIKELKSKYDQQIIFIAGGPHPTGDPENTLKKGFNIVVVGEGEKAFPDLLKKVISDKEFKQGITPRQEPIDVDKYPPFAERHRKFNSIEITRGCSFACKFCETSFLYGPVRHRSTDQICKYVKIMFSHGLKDIRFISPNAFSYGSKDGREVNLEAIENLLKPIREIIKDEGRIFLGSFPSEVRPGQVSKEIIELIKKYADNDNLIIGAQSGSPKILKECRRQHTVEDIYNAVKLVLEAGLKANVDFIFGLPRETKEDLSLTIKVMEDLIKMGAKIHGHTFMPLVGTPYANEPAGKIDNENLKKLQKLDSDGKLYGDWKEQIQIAKDIVKLKK